MENEWIRTYCLSFPHATEKVQWEHDLVFKIADKMFAVLPLEPSLTKLSFKCTPESFAELIERPGVIPAPYLARAQWVSLESSEAIAQAELRGLLREAYETVFSKLPKKTRVALRD